MKFILVIFSVLFYSALLQGQPPFKNTAVVKIQYSPGHPLNILKPVEMIGAAFDGHSQGDIKDILTTQNVQAMLSAGLHPVSYRLRTELGIEAWHWNPDGTWSEGEKKQGYWISDSVADKPIQVSNGYRLPRRGNTHDQANDDGYSRIDDGDTATFWKSNPYLDQYYTNESNSLHPQWAIIDLGKSVLVNAIRIRWGNPYALSYKADYAGDIGDAYFDPQETSLWHSFSKGNIINQQGENKIMRISIVPVKARFIRITMVQGSNTTPSFSSDIRDKLGFAIKEMQAGFIDSKNIFHDYIKHNLKNNIQSVMYVSSTDPWHRSTDIDINTEQAGVDLFFASGIANHQPAMMPVGLLYDTPGNMQALIQYIISKHYPVEELEMGEEPEGQLVNPEDYASLYYQWGKILRKINPLIKLGGPGFAAMSINQEDQYSFSERKWTTRFLNYLKEHNSTGMFNFFSFEWYPFDDICAPTAPQLAAAPQMLDAALKDFSNHILPAGTPVYVTEYGYSAQSGRAESDIEGALMYADILGKFLTLGGNKSFLYGYEPTYPGQYHQCEWGNNMLFGMGDSGKIIYKTAAYYGMKMITENWAYPAAASLEIYAATCDFVNKLRQPLITAYAILKPDHKWSLLLINKDPSRAISISAAILNNGQASALHFPLSSVQYSGLQYHWKNEGSDSHPTLALPPVEKNINKLSPIVLPAYSLTILTEQ